MRTRATSRNSVLYSVLYWSYKTRLKSDLYSVEMKISKLILAGKPA
jgi:hypothetical protein